MPKARDSRSKLEEYDEHDRQINISLMNHFFKLIYKITYFILKKSPFEFET